MSAPHYGQHTLMRPMLINVPDAPAGAELSACPYCDRSCWVMPQEQNLPPVMAAVSHTSACSACAFSRNNRQAELDMGRWLRENAEVCDLAADG